MKDSSIVVIDDEKDIVKIVTAVLNQEGLTAIGTSDPLEAIRLVAQNQSIKLILSDLMMPNVTGPEVVRVALKSREDCVRVAFMSGSPERLPFRRTDRFLQKPLRLDELVRAVRQSLVAEPAVVPWDGPERRRRRLA